MVLVVQGGSKMARQRFSLQLQPNLATTCWWSQLRFWLALFVVDMLKCYISPGPGAVTAIRSRSTDSEADSILEIDDVGSTESTTSSSQSQLLRIEQELEHGSRVLDPLDVVGSDDADDEVDELELQQKKERDDHDVDREDQEDEPSFVQEFEQLESHSAAEAVGSGTAQAQHAETSRKSSDCGSSQYTVTCSSERHRDYNGGMLPVSKRGCANIIDCNYGTFGQTGDRIFAVPAIDVAQQCPWFQIDLGEEMHVSSVSVVVPSHPKHLRQLFFTEVFASGQTKVGSNDAPGWHNIHPPNDGANFPESPQNPAAFDDGFRVIVAKTPREVAGTCEMQDVSGSQLCLGKAYGAACPASSADVQVCDTVRFGRNADSKDGQGFHRRFSDAASGTKRVDVRCGKTGRFVVIDAPGGSAAGSGTPLKLRSLNIGEVEIQARPRMDVTCSSEINGGTRACANILDGDYTTFGNTGGHAAGAAEGATTTVGQKCPWYQIDLGREMRVNAVAIVVPDEPGRMRRLFFTQPSRAEIQPSLPIAYDNRGPFPSNDPDQMGGAYYAGVGSAYYDGSFAESDQNTNSTDDGFRVSVTKEARVGTGNNSTCTERDDPNGHPFCAGTGVGNACPTNWRQQMAECETVRFGKNDRAPGAEFAATYHSRFHAEHPTTGKAARRVAVRCEEKIGRYIVIDAPGIKENDPDPTHLRALAISEVEVFTPEERYAATEWDLTPTDADRVTCSSEASADRACRHALDNNQNAPPETTGFAASTGGGSGSFAQICPWLQVDLGEEKEISQVHLTFPGNYRYLRWLFFTTPGQVAGAWDSVAGGVLNTTSWDVIDVNYPEHRQNDARDAGFRVLVLKGESDRIANSHTCENAGSAATGGTYCKGKAAGAVCRVHYDERFQLCEIVKYGKDKGGEEFARRFRKTEDGTFTVTVACNRKRGRYVVVDLPGGTASPETRILAMNEIAVIGGN